MYWILLATVVIVAMFFICYEGVVQERAHAKKLRTLKESAMVSFGHAIWNFNEKKELPEEHSLWEFARSFLGGGTEKITKDRELIERLRQSQSFNEKQLQDFEAKQFYSCVSEGFINLSIEVISEIEDETLPESFRDELKSCIKQWREEWEFLMREYPINLINQVEF